MKHIKIIVSSIITASLVPLISYAQVIAVTTNQCTSGTNLCTLISRIIGYFGQVLILLIGLSIVTFVFYIWKYFVKANEDRTEAGRYVMYSLIGFFVMLSLWGLVNIAENTFGLGNSINSPQSWTDLQGIFPNNTSGTTNIPTQQQTIPGGGTNQFTN